MKLQHLKAARLTKKARKLLKGGNAAVSYSIEKGEKIGKYIGATPVYFNKAGRLEVANFAKVKAGIPFVRTELHGL